MIDIDILPPRAREKLTTLQDSVDESAVLLASFLKKINDLRAAVNGSVFNHKRNAQDTREIARLSAKQVEQQVRHRESSQLLAQLDHWLTNLPKGVTLEDARHPRPKVSKGGTLDAIERVRGEIKSVQKQINEVQRAVPTSDELKAAARTFVKAQADRATPKIMSNQHGSFNLTFGAMDWSSPKVEPFAHLCWLNPDAVIAKLESDIDAMPPATLALSETEKASRLADLSFKIEQLQRDEEMLIEIAYASGNTISRRPTASPLAVLGVSFKAKMAAPVAIPETVA